MLCLLVRHPHERGKLVLDEAFVDATFARAKKGASQWGRPDAEKAPESLLFLLTFMRWVPVLREKCACREAI